MRGWNGGFHEKNRSRGCHRCVDGIRKLAAEAKSTAADPQVVLDAVIHALESPKPKTRYVMGTGAGQRKFLRMLPDRLRDRALLKAFGL